MLYRLDLPPEAFTAFCWGMSFLLISQLFQFFCKSTIKGTVSQTAHVQVINQKWSDVFKFVICETKWRQQAEDNPHSHGGRRNNSGRKQFFFKFQQWQEKGTGEVEKKNSARNKYLQVVVTGQTWSHVQFNKKQRVRDEFTLVRKS